MHPELAKKVKERMSISNIIDASIEEEEFEKKRLSRNRLPDDWNDEKRERYRKFLKHSSYLRYKEKGLTTSREYLDKETIKSTIRYKKIRENPELYKSMRERQRIYERKSKIKHASEIKNEQELASTCQVTENINSSN
jgi:hypothetical protein